MRPYISVDLETSGLDLEKSEILEVGAVFDDGVSPIEKLQSFSFVISLQVLTHAEPYAVNMNARLFQAMVNKEGVSVVTAFDALTALFREASSKAQMWDIDWKFKPGPRVYIAGKNAASFDIPIIKSFLKRHEYPAKELLQLIHYQVLDVGSMYFPDFGRIPSLSDISAKIGRKEVTHKALDDAFDVVHAIRHKFSNTHWATIGDKINGT
jgi:oligoribonuclease (3'-5' exoribonuclease)